MNPVDDRHRGPEREVLRLGGERALERPVSTRALEDRAEDGAVREVPREGA
jgi:hypothetical protein